MPRSAAFSAAGLRASDLLGLVRSRVGSGDVGVQARRPFRFLLCGDPGLVAALRRLLLRGSDVDNAPGDAASTLETIDPFGRRLVPGPDVRAAIFLGYPGDLAGARLDLVQALGVPIFALVVDPLGAAEAAAPLVAPSAREIATYVVPAIEREPLRGRFFPHLIERCNGTEVAVGRRLPVLREAVAAKLTRDAASAALKIAGASAAVESLPILGLALGPMTSAGDMVAITGIQLVLMMQIGAAYGHDPDLARIWEMLPIVGGGLGWRALARELSGFVPVAGIAIKAAIAYAGTIVVGEGVGFFYEHGHHMTAAQAGAIYEERKRTVLSLAQDFTRRLRPKGR
ncbi:MAG: hypothetical protein ACREM2_09800 [Vulcanimicrobiaceae bacterium]